MRLAYPLARGSEEQENEPHHEKHAEDALGDGQVDDFDATSVVSLVIVSGVVLLSVVVTVVVGTVIVTGGVVIVGSQLAVVHGVPQTGGSEVGTVVQGAAQEDVELPDSGAYAMTGSGMCTSPMMWISCAS